MALQLLNGVGAGVVSKVLDIRSVGTRMVPFIVYGGGTAAAPQTGVTTVEKAPTPSGPWVNLGSINPPSGQVLVDEPITDSAGYNKRLRTGVVSVCMTTSR